MKKVYILLTYIGSTLSRIIRICTGYEYSHVSIGLDKDLNKLYSFGRLYAYNPFYAGFVHEGVDFGTFKRFKKTTAKLYSLDISDESYELIKKEIYNMSKKKNKYKFNILGLILASKDIRFKRKNSFYCAEFVKYIFDMSNVNLELPEEIIKPQDFDEIEEMEFVFSGLLKDYENNH